MLEQDSVIIEKAKRIVTSEIDYTNPEDILEAEKKLYALCLTSADDYYVLMSDVFANIILTNLSEFRNVVLKYAAKSDKSLVHKMLVESDLGLQPEADKTKASLPKLDNW